MSELLAEAELDNFRPAYLPKLRALRAMTAYAESLLQRRKWAEVGAHYPTITVPQLTAWSTAPRPTVTALEAVREFASKHEPFTAVQIADWSGHHPKHINVACRELLRERKIKVKREAIPGSTPRVFQGVA